MADSQELTVIVRFDAELKKTIAVEPDPVAVPYGNHTLYFSLQVVHPRPSRQPAFLEIVSNDLETFAGPVEGSGQLWSAVIENSGEGETRHPYSIFIESEGNIHRHDPTVILKPPPIPS